MSEWDKFKQSYTPDETDFPANRVSWDRVGAGITGRISNVRFPEFDGKLTPELWIIDARGVEWQATAGPGDLKSKLLALLPEKGDVIAIALKELRPTNKGNAKKVFSVQLQRQGSETVEDAEANTSSAEALPAPMAAPAPSAPVQSPLMPAAAPSPLETNPFAAFQQQS